MESSAEEAEHPRGPLAGRPPRHGDARGDAGQAIAFRWTHDADRADGVTVAIEAVPTLGVLEQPAIAWGPLTSLVAVYVVPAAAARVQAASGLLPAGVYQVTGRALDDGGAELAKRSPTSNQGAK